MKTTFTNTALALATLFSLAGSAAAQAPADSLFDSIQSNAVESQQYRSAPTAQSAPQYQVAPAINPNYQTAPQPYVQPAPLVLPPTCTKLPKLQFSGTLIYGVGMQVVSAEYGGVAQQVGLEPGDIIVQIDDQPIRSAADYENALLRAAIYHDGHVDLVVRNVRYRPGCTINREFVSIHADLPTRCIAPAIVAAR